MINVIKASSAWVWFVLISLPSPMQLTIDTTTSYWFSDHCAYEWSFNNNITHDKVTAIPNFKLSVFLAHLVKCGSQVKL